MRIVQVASELFPYIKTGGLADVVGALATALAERGHEVEVFVPAYRALRDAPLAAGARRTATFAVALGTRQVGGRILSLEAGPRCTVHLVARDEFFDRRHLYCWDGERDYDDNDARFIFFAKAVVELLRRGEDGPVDALHAHDWQAGLVPLLVREAERQEGRRLVGRTVFTIHNLAFQGLFDAASFALTNLPEALFTSEGLEFHGRLNLLKAGARFADRVTTVSPTYSREVLTPAAGAGLDGVLRQRGGAFSGIRNGIDRQVWNPATDAGLPARFSADEPSGKAVCRAGLLRTFGWSEPVAGPVFGLVSRMTGAKGHDLVLGAIEEFLGEADCRLVVLGSGEHRYQRAYRELVAARPDRLALCPRLDESMSHLVMAGADFFLMPSQTEPCGLTQMYAMAYGTVPLASRVGGLADTVEDLDDSPRTGTGFLFPPEAAGFTSALRRAWRLWADADRLAEVRRRGMGRDFSWTRPVAEYERLYAGGAGGD